MMTQAEPESGMFQDEGTYSYSKRSKSPEHPVNGPSSVSEKLYVGHLPFQVSKRELDDLFGRYGPVANVEIKHGGYAFVQFGKYFSKGRKGSGRRRCRKSSPQLYIRW
jgi:RNA recognition motif-containing protein